jgi:hypothetical protein
VVPNADPLTNRERPFRCRRRFGSLSTESGRLPPRGQVTFHSICYLLCYLLPSWPTWTCITILAHSEREERSHQTHVGGCTPPLSTLRGLVWTLHMTGAVSHPNLRRLTIFQNSPPSPDPLAHFPNVFTRCRCHTDHQGSWQARGQNPLDRILMTPYSNSSSQDLVS